MEERAHYKLDRKITVDEYQRLGREGFFPEDVRLELIDGEVREMSPVGPVHAGIVDRITEALMRRLIDTHRTRVQNPIDLDARNEPQPDIVVARRLAELGHRHPNPSDVLLAIEVSDSTLRQDRRQNIPPYARAGILEAWVNDVASRRIHVFTQPAGITYQSETCTGSTHMALGTRRPPVRQGTRSGFDRRGRCEDVRS